MVTLSLLAASLLRATGPVVADYLLLQDERTLGLRVSLGTNPSKSLILVPGWSRSYLRRADAKARAGVPVRVGGVSLGSVAFRVAPADMPLEPGVEGALGRDALGKTAVGVDLDGKVALWPGGRVAPAEAEAWVRGDSKAKVARIPLLRLKDGMPAVATTVGGRRATAVLGFALSSTIVLRSAAPEVRRVGGGEGSPCVAPVAVGDAPPTLLGFLVPPRNEEAVQEKNFHSGGASAQISLEAFGSRRVLVDFAANAVYVERASEDDRLSFFLGYFLRFPLAVEGDRIVVRAYAMRQMEQGAGDLLGSTATRVAGRPAAEWLEALRGAGKDPERLARLLRLTERAFVVTVQTPDGSEQEVDVEGVG